MVEGKRVRLELDPANAATGHKDNTQQRRTLAYVFLDDGRLLNAEIIKQGYGFALSRYPFARMEEFRRLEREARHQRRVSGTGVDGSLDKGQRTAVKERDALQSHRLLTRHFSCSSSR
jgi:Staphylococcal nuclease homologue